MTQEIIALVIFIVVITLIISGKVHETTAALAGAAALLITHIFTITKAISYVDFDTICVLVGMMMFVSVVKHSGLFEYVAIKCAKMAKGDPWKIMVAFMILTAVCSAFLDNVTTVLLVGPMAIIIAKILKINPIPMLLGQIFASNIGGTMTMIGDPPNIMIGSAAHLSFLDFIENTGVACVIGLIAVIFAMKIAYKKKLKADAKAIKKVMELDENKAISDKRLLKISVVMIILIIIAFFFHDKLGIESGTVALTAGVVMLLIGRQDVEETIHDVEWPTILFFIGLFVCVGGLEATGFISQLGSLIMKVSGGHLVATMLILLWASALISAILNNVPFIATLIPLVLALGHQGMNITPLWWAISLGACLGGNGTQIGASANVVLSGIAGKNGYPISFSRYTKVGMPVMLITILISTGFLLLKFGHLS